MYIERAAAQDGREAFLRATKNSHETFHETGLKIYLDERILLQRIRSRQDVKTIPFFLPHGGCPHRCTFCDQKQIGTNATLPTPEFVSKTIEAALNQGKAGAVFHVGFFGGSFTGLPIAVQEAFLSLVAPFRPDITGIRISTRPDMVADETLERLLSYRVTTVELGAQSMDDTVLAASERGHSADCVVDAARSVKKAGFRLGIQTLPGLPLDTFEKTIKTAEAVIRLYPDEVRIYPALVLPGTKLEMWMANGSYRPLSLEEAVQWCVALEKKYTAAAIPIIKMGLHASETFQGKAGKPQGPWHPAFRELVADAQVLEEVNKRIDRQGIQATDVFTLSFAKLLWQRFVGHKKENLLQLKKRYPNINLQIAAE